MKLKECLKPKQERRLISIINFDLNLSSAWKAHQIRFLLKKRITDGPHETPEFINSGIPFLSVDSIQEGKIIFEGCRFISIEDQLRFKQKCLPKRGDILLGKAASIGKIAIVDVDREFNVWSPLAVLRPDQNKILSKFLYYALRSDYCQDQIDLYATSNTQKNISMDDIPSIKIIMPDSIQEQMKRANFLDKKLSNIDLLIKRDTSLKDLLQEKRIALINHFILKGLNINVKLDNSGSDWLGKIPKHWKVRRLRFNCIVNPSDQKFVHDENQKVSFLPMEKVSEKGIVDYASNRHYWEVSSGYTYFQDRDVLIAKITPCFENGKGALVNGLMNGFGFGTTEFQVLRSNNDIEPKYLYYLTYSHLFRVIGEAFMQGSAGQKRVGTDFTKDFPMPTPPKDEQIEIVKFLDNETSKIDEIIDKIEKKIDLLEEYKKSLIHHVVTGKMNVTGVA